MRQTLQRLRRSKPFQSKLFRSAIFRSQQAATAVEYGLICALIVLAMVSALQSVANKTIGMWGNIANEVSNH
jgi:pilus assembly protein Flp/PilA